MPGQSLETGQAAVTGGRGHGGVYAGAVAATAPAVCLKVRVPGGIEGLQGELSHSRLWVLGGLWVNPQD